MNELKGKLSTDQYNYLNCRLDETKNYKHGQTMVETDSKDFKNTLGLHANQAKNIINLANKTLRLKSMMKDNDLVLNNKNNPLLDRKLQIQKTNKNYQISFQDTVAKLTKTNVQYEIKNSNIQEIPENFYSLVTRLASQSVILMTSDTSSTKFSKHSVSTNKPFTNLAVNKFMELAGKSKWYSEHQNQASDDCE
jgi:phosphotransferase system IIB component